MTLLTHPDLYRQLSDRGFFPDAITVKVNTSTVRSAAGAVVPVWEDLEGHVDLAGAIGDLTTRERMSPDKSISMAEQKLLLAGFYPAIRTHYEIESGGIRYRITYVQADSLEQITLAYLERVST